MKQLNFKQDKNGNLKTSISGLLYLIENNYLFDGAIVTQVPFNSTEEIEYSYFDDESGIDILKCLNENNKDEEDDESDIFLVIDEEVINSEFFISSEDYSFDDTDKEYEDKRKNLIMEDNKRFNDEIEKILDNLSDEDIDIIFEDNLFGNSLREFLNELSNGDEFYILKFDEHDDEEDDDEEEDYDRLIDIMDLFNKEHTSIKKELTEEEKLNIIKEEHIYGDNTFQLEDILLEVKEILEK